MVIAYSVYAFLFLSYLVHDQIFSHVYNAGHDQLAMLKRQERKAENISCRPQLGLSYCSIFPSYIEPQVKAQGSCRIRV